MLYQLVLPTTYCGKASYDNEICCAVVAFIQDLRCIAGFCFTALFTEKKK